jgi:hypothetical protein
MPTPTNPELLGKPFTFSTLVKVTGQLGVDISGSADALVGEEHGVASFSIAGLINSAQVLHGGELLRTSVHGVVEAVDMPEHLPYTFSGVWGQPLNCQLIATAVARARLARVPVDGSVQSIALFDKTVSWGGIVEARDDLGQLIPLSEFSLLSTDGVDYKTSAVVVPEPPIGMLLGGLLLFVSSYWGKRVPGARRHEPLLVCPTM